MTDRELLELAAKAWGGLAYVDGFGWIEENEAGNRGKWWNPLLDDRDALRLAVKLGISIFPPQVPKQQGDFAVASLPGDDGAWIQEFIKNDDPYAATRRAIVSAAAEIGKAMEDLEYAGYAAETALAKVRKP